MLVTSGNEKIVVKMLCIHYLIQFQDSQEHIKALLNSGSKINAINFDYIQKLGFKIRKTNIGAQKIDDSALETFGMVIADFQGEDKAIRFRFFEKIFLITNIKFEVILKMLFLKISNVEILFGKKHLRRSLILSTRPYLSPNKSIFSIQKNLL